MNFCMEKSAKSPNVQSLQSPKLSVSIGQRLCGSETSNIDQKTLKSMIVEGCKKSLSYPTKSLRKQVVLSPELHSCQKPTKTAPFWNNLYNHVVVCEESKSSKDSLMLGEGYKKLYTFKFKTTKSGIFKGILSIIKSMKLLILTRMMIDLQIRRISDRLKQPRN